MNKYLVEFVKENIGQTVWFLSPGGLISGELHDIDKGSLSIGVVKAFHHFGKQRLSLGDINIITNCNYLSIGNFAASHSQLSTR